MSREAMMAKNFPHPHLIILQRCFVDINRYTLPIFKLREEEVRPFGSGTLLCIGHHHFILTAAHIVEDLENVRAPYFLPPREEEGEPFPLLPLDLVSTPMPEGVTERIHDPVDVSLVELKPDAVEHLSIRRAFAGLGDFGQSSDTTRGLYLLSGYARDHQNYVERLRLSMNRTRHHVTELDEEKATPEHKFHLLMRYPKDLLIDSNGNEPVRTDPNGMSGCGVWKMVPKTPGEWTTSDRKLVGVQHTHSNKKQQLTATRIEVVVELICHKFPDLMPHFGDLNWKGVEG
jgi:hypothetical protein